MRGSSRFYGERRGYITAFRDIYVAAFSVLLALQVLAFLRLVRQDGRRLLPGFLLFLGVSTITDFALMAISLYWPGEYYRWWEILDPPTWLFEVWAAVECGNKLLDCISRPGTAQAFRRGTFFFIAAVASGVGWLAVWFSFGAGADPFRHHLNAILAMKRYFLATILVASLMIVWLFTALSGFAERRGTHVIAHGLLTHARLLTTYFFFTALGFFGTQWLGNTLQVRRSLDMFVLVATVFLMLRWATLEKDALEMPPLPVSAEEGAEQLRFSRSALKRSVETLARLSRRAHRAPPASESNE